MHLRSRRSLLAAAALAGCGKPSQAKIGVIVKAVGHLFFAAVHSGVKRAAKEFGIEVVWNGPTDETDSPRQIQILDSMIAQRVSAIAISACDERALAAPVKRAIDQGIPVTVFDSAVEGSGFVTFVATDNFKAGCDAARELAKLIGEKGKVGVVMHKPGGASTSLRERGFQETIAKEFPNVIVAASQYGMADRAKARAAAENMITAHPDMAGIFASSEASSLGAIQAITTRGLSGKLRLITFDTSEAHREALRGGTIDIMMVQDSARIGYEAVKSLAEKLRGGTPVGRMDLPVRQIRKADIDKPEIAELISPPTE